MELVQELGKWVYGYVARRSGGGGGGVFFFQAEDGIRDHCVTGVQTCALPIRSDPALAYARNR